MNDEKKNIVNIPEAELPLIPWSLRDLKQATRERITSIADEFGEGFDLLENYPKSVTFFGSARTQPGDPDYEKARELAKKIATELQYAVITGGGPGIMEAANRGAHEAGGPSLGLLIDLPGGQAMNPYIDEYVNFHYFFSRKVCLSFSAEAYIFFPGGYGTLDELFEILTLIQTHKIKRVPIFLVDGEYWKKWDKFIYEELLSREKIDERDTDLYIITEEDDYIIELIKNVPVRGTMEHGADHKEAEERGDSAIG